MSNIKQSFVLFDEIRQPLDKLTMAQRGEVFTAILNYAATGEEPHLEGGADIAFAFIRLSLDRNGAKWEETRAKRAQAGRKGGKTTQARRSQAKQTEANQAVPVPVPEPVPEPVPVPAPVCKREGAGGAAPSHTFVPPTVEEVRLYCRERGNRVDPESFVDFYAAKGWKVGNQRMRDWQAALRNWERREAATPPPRPGGGGGKGNPFLDLMEEGRG